tara:strand:- start:14988 stop:15728 length:741 start_codon:yes stop_codon:yes gene_type:complete
MSLNQIALITGASRGIGKAIALKLGKDGAVVLGTATTYEGARNISRYLNEANIKGKGITLDVNDNMQIKDIFMEIRKEFGEVTILVNNAGITRDDLLVRMKDDKWNEVIGTNLKSIFCLSREVLRPMMAARSGRIINIASIVGSTGNAGQSNYAAAKAGILGLSKSLAREVGSRNITINCISPGFVDTDMTRALSEKQRQELLQHIPLKRLGKPEDIASAVSFLASPSAGYITGATLHINGGMYME